MHREVGSSPDRRDEVVAGLAAGSPPPPTAPPPRALLRPMPLRRARRGRFPLRDEAREARADLADMRDRLGRGRGGGASSLLTRVLAEAMVEAQRCVWVCCAETERGVIWTL